MATFQAKIDGKGCEREKIKIIVPFRFYTMRNRKFQKNSKKIQNIKKHHCGYISSHNWMEKSDKQRKYKLSFRFVPT